jgi:hypothetical protein
VSEPLISLVVPTRNRADTLEVCLRAMRHHKARNIEIVVQDNSTNPDTRDLVEEMQKQDARIRYSRAPYPTSQRHNFELGLAAARGEYMAIIGDDDAFAIGVVDWLAERLKARDVDAVRWNLLHYVWPSLSVDGEGFMDLYPSQCAGGSRVEQAGPLAEKVIKLDLLGSWQNILVYHGMISRRVYDRMKAVTGGVFFHYPLPDVYAHNILPFMCENYLQIDDVGTIYGVSGHSAGASWTRGRTTNAAAAREGDRWMAESMADEIAEKVAWHPEIRTIRYHDLAVLHLAKDLGFLGDRTIDFDAWASAVIDELKLNSESLAAWFTVEPKTSFDAELIGRVRSAFKEPPAVQDGKTNKKSWNEMLPSLRVGAVGKGLPDDVEGAMLALADMTSSDPGRFDLVASPAQPRSSVTPIIKRVALRVRAMAPGLSSRVLNSRFMPRRLWVYFKLMQQNEKTIVDYNLYKDIRNKMSRYSNQSMTSEN